LQFPESIAAALGLASTSEAVALLRGGGAGYASHAHVEAALDLLANEDTIGAPAPASALAAGEAARFLRADAGQWEGKLRALIEGITARRAAGV
jgi:hypothetical protein